MIVFADSSAIVKLYVDEQDSEAVRELTGTLTISALAQVEVPAAFWRKYRVGDVQAEAASVMARLFSSDFRVDREGGPRFAMVEVGALVLGAAARAVGRHPLRAYDAVQLASAIEFRRAVGESVDFACFDRSLRSAAAAEGFAVVPADLM